MIHIECGRVGLLKFEEQEDRLFDGGRHDSGEKPAVSG